MTSCNHLQCCPECHAKVKKLEALKQISKNQGDRAAAAEQRIAELEALLEKGVGYTQGLVNINAELEAEIERIKKIMSYVDSLYTTAALEEDDG